MPKPKADKKPVVRRAAPLGFTTALVFDLAVIVLTLVCFWPLTRFYFAQDDFVLLEQASRGFASAVGGFFEARPGQFRPLSKGMYFLLTWPLLGLNASAFHVLSILLHAANAILVAVLLRRLGITAAVSRFVAALFAFNAGYLEVVAWVSCVQQLIGNGFMLLALIFGIDALEGGSTRRRIASFASLACAFASYEQTLAAPVVLLGWHATRHGVSATLRAVRARLWEQPLLLVLYLLFTLGVRGVPDAGPYVMSLGTHVLNNLREYAGLAYALWIVFPAYGLPGGFTPSHGALIVVAAFLLWRRRYRELLFGVGTFLALLVPVLFVKDHTHSFHLYVPAIGTWFLAAQVLDDALVPLREMSAGMVRQLLVIAALAVFVVSAFIVRANTTALVSESVRLPRSFVLRRAILAERMRDDLLARSQLFRKPGRLVLVYPHPQYKANWRNVHAALGQGSAVRLFLESPDLDLIFAPPSEIPIADDPAMEVMVYTEQGRCYTADEVLEAQERRAAARGRRTPAMADTTRVTPLDE